MKKLLTMCLIMATVFTLNAQDTKPTKEETISWLKEKLTKYLLESGNENISPGSKNLLVSISPCEITLEYSYRNKYFDKDEEDHQYKHTIPTDGLTFDDGKMSTTEERILTQKIEKNKKQKYYLKKIEGFTLVEGETNLRARVKKALDHLATFCPKKKETF